MTSKQTDFFEVKSPKRRQRLNSKEAELIRLMRIAHDKPKVDVSLPYTDPFILTPRNLKR